MTDEDTLRGLQTKLTDLAPRIRRNDAYYAGQLRLAALGMSLPPEMRALQTVVNWPRVTVDALEERIDLTAFRMFGQDTPDDRLWSWWQANNMDEEWSLAVLEMLVQGRAYITVGYDEDRPNVPIYTCESARNMIADVDPRTRKVKAAARLYDHTPEGGARSATLYLPDRTLFLVSDRGRWRTSDSIDGIGRVPVVPLVNRSRLHERVGVSEMEDTIGITDAACRSLTNLQGAQELLAVPTRYVFGITEADMKDQDGNTVTRWEAYLGRFNTLGNTDARVEQLPAADLRNFATTMELYAKLVTSVTGLPAHYLGQTTENPASADAIRSGEARHVKRAERKCKVVGGTAEEVQRLGMLTVDGSIPDEAERMESVFADCSTPTYAAKVDGVVKLSGAGLLPDEMAWEELGWSPEKRRRAAQMKAQDPMNRLAGSMGVPTGPGLLDRLGDSPTDGVTA